MKNVKICWDDRHKNLLIHEYTSSFISLSNIAIAGMLTFICALNTTNIKGTWRLMPYLYIPIECSFMFPSFVDRFYNGQNDIDLSTDELDEKIGENHEGNFLIPWWFWQKLPIKDDNRNGNIIYETYNFKQNKTFKVDNLILL